MQCPRLVHFARFNHNGTISRCGHMIDAPTFGSYEDMESSSWLKRVKEEMSQNKWPKECIRCKTAEEISGKSIRTDMIERDRLLSSIKKDYLVVGGVLDNICNSACHTCNESLSSKIGSLKNSPVKVNNYDRFFELPQQQILELDINGGEPTYSPNYKKLLDRLPDNVKIIRINTNCSTYFNKIEELLDKGFRVILTISLDGVGMVHDYVRWPVIWDNFDQNLKRYSRLREKYKMFRLNTWTTLSVLNLQNFQDILHYVKQEKLDHEFALLEKPFDLSVKRTNPITAKCKQEFATSPDDTLKKLSHKLASDEKTNLSMLKKLIAQNDSFRKISYKDYLNFDLNLL